MQIEELQVGSKVTVHEHNWRSSRNEPSTILTIASISSRVLKTDDGRRWHPRRGTMLSDNGKESNRGPRIYVYKDGDEKVVALVGLVNQCRDLLSPTYPNDGPMENMGLLGEDDWKTLAEIANRYKQSLDNKKTS